MLTKLRPATKSDFNFIVSTFMKSYQPNTRLTHDVYYRFQRRQIINILNNSITIIACSEESPETIFGYIIYDVLVDIEPTPVVHWIYVKSALRGFGVSKLLTKHLDQSKIYYTHKNKSKLKELWTYNPYLTNKENYNEQS